jgi:hypothetical protein
VRECARGRVHRALFSNGGERAMNAAALFLAEVERAGGSCDGFAAFRKPMLGMWEMLVERRGVAATPELLGASFYCGVAAGPAAAGCGSAEVTKKRFC